MELKCSQAGARGGPSSSMVGVLVRTGGRQRCSDVPTSQRLPEDSSQTPSHQHCLQGPPARSGRVGRGHVSSPDHPRLCPCMHSKEQVELGSKYSNQNLNCQPSLHTCPCLLGACFFKELTVSYFLLSAYPVTPQLTLRSQGWILDCVGIP